jgi:hypothetical protein
MSTTVAQILDRLDAILRANVLPGTQVFRDRMDPQSRDETPSINVIARDDNAAPYSAEFDRHEAIVELRIEVRDAVPTPLVEAQHAAVHTTIVRDTVLLGLCVSVRHLGATYDRAEADLTALVKVVQYRFTFLIPQDTL